VPAQGMDPSALNAALLTAASLTGTFTSVSVSSLQPLNVSVTGQDVADHYDLSGALTYTTNVALVGTGTTWTAHGGDANLDEAVDVFDLSVLANNYQVAAAQDWTTADYDLSGLVDVFDLAELANNYGWTAGGGGDPVPEPATLGLIVLGALAVIRRRRR